MYWVVLGTNAGVSDLDERQSEEVSAAIRARDNDAVNSTRRGVNLAKIRKEFLTILITC